MWVGCEAGRRKRLVEFVSLAIVRTSAVLADGASALER